MLTVAYESDPNLWFELLLAASVGNTLGACVNWTFGRWTLAAKDKKWFPFKDKKLDRATRWFQRWGIWSLLLAWTPLVGDVLTFIAGTFKVNIWHFILLVGFGKTLRYVVVILVAKGIF